MTDETPALRISRSKSFKKNPKKNANKEGKRGGFFDNIFTARRKSKQLKLDDDNQLSLDMPKKLASSNNILNNEDAHNEIKKNKSLGALPDYDKKKDVIIPNVGVDSISNSTSPRNLTERSKHRNPIDFIRKTITQKDNAPIYLKGLSYIEASTFEAQEYFLLDDIEQSHNILQNVFQEFSLLKKDGFLDNNSKFTLACAHYYNSQCYLSKENLVSAESQARESLDILDNFILLENLDNIKSSQVNLVSQWIPGQLFNMDSIWLRKSDVEELLGRILLKSKLNSIAVEWLQRACFSRENAGLTVNAEIACNLANVVVDMITVTMDKSRILLHSQSTDLCCNLLKTLDAFDHLDNAKNFLGEASKNCKGDIPRRLKVLLCLLNVLVTMQNLGELEVDVGIKKKAFVSNTNRRIDRKVDKIRKEIRKLQRKEPSNNNAIISKKLRATNSLSGSFMKLHTAAPLKSSLSDSTLKENDQIINNNNDDNGEIEKM